jgi:hypothetical protein
MRLRMQLKNLKQQFIANITTDAMPNYTLDIANLIHYFSSSLTWN